MSAPTESPPFENRLREAHAALLAGRSHVAERLLRSLDAELPGDPSRRWLIGVSLLDQGRTAESIDILHQVLERAGDFTIARIDLARAYRAAGETTLAREQVRRVLAEHPHHARAWLAYGDVLVDLQQYSDARTAFDRARECDPERARVEAATAALVADDRKTSEEVFRQILKANPAHVAALCGLAALSLAADVPSDAERLLRHALRQSAHLPLAWRGLWSALLGLGRLEEADAAARYLRTIEPDSPHSWIATAAVAARLLRQEDSLAAYERAAQLKPDERLPFPALRRTPGEGTPLRASSKKS